MKRLMVVSAIAISAVTCALPAAAEGHTLTVLKAKQALYAYAEGQNALQFRVRYCRRRSRHHVRCAVKEVFLEGLLGSHESWERTDYYWMAVKFRRPRSSSTSRSGVLIYDDVKGRWVAWSRR